MSIPDSFLDELNSRLSIVDVVSSYVTLNKRGANYWGLCPFHREKTPSFSVNEEKQIFHCFGCGKGGGAIRFVMEIENLSFPDAVRRLAQRAGMEVPEEDRGDRNLRERRKRVLELNREAARFYRAMLDDPRGAAVADYIVNKRRISPKFSARFGLGAAPDAWDTLIRAMAEKGVIADLLPGTPFYLMLDTYAPARKMLDAGVPVALATDFNPNTSPTESLQIIMNLASIEMRMTAKEVLAGVTINAAYSIHRGDSVGSLEPGKLADIVIWDAPDVDFLSYHFGVNLAQKVFKKGKLVAQDGKLLG